MAVSIAASMIYMVFLKEDTNAFSGGVVPFLCKGYKRWCIEEACCGLHKDCRHSDSGVDSKALIAESIYWRATETTMLRKRISRTSGRYLTRRVLPCFGRSLGLICASLRAWGMSYRSVTSRHAGYIARIAMTISFVIHNPNENEIITMMPRSS